MLAVGPLGQQYMLAVGPLGPQYSLLFAWHELGREACLEHRHPPYPEGTSKVS